MIMYSLSISVADVCCDFMVSVMAYYRGQSSTSNRSHVSRDSIMFMI